MEAVCWWQALAEAESAEGGLLSGAHLPWPRRDRRYPPTPDARPVQQTGRFGAHAHHETNLASGTTQPVVPRGAPGEDGCAHHTSGSSAQAIPEAPRACPAGPVDFDHAHSQPVARSRGSLLRRDGEVATSRLPGHRGATRALAADAVDGSNACGGADGGAHVAPAGGPGPIQRGPDRLTSRPSPSR